MAALQMVTVFPASTAFPKRASVSGFQGRRTLRVSCQRRVVDEQSGGESDGGSQADVSILQSSRNPLLNLPREELMAALGDNQVESAVGVAAPVVAASDSPSGQRRRSERVVFTAEKARLLRKENRATQTFHDKWYHSAIASKLAMPE
ncbi:hypothetical protein M758_12G137100 [Ceratodon purpureus]|nr:hypothetical protein M758_12G137100 [Ceratodon purpureus]KAG0599226.1 hypothetical protein M758_12G137100 [Ceratodon purpureus]